MSRSSGGRWTHVPGDDPRSTRVERRVRRQSNPATGADGPSAWAPGRAPGRGWLLLCAVVGVLLLVGGAWALPRPSNLGQASEPASAPPGGPAAPAPGTVPTTSSTPATPSSSSGAEPGATTAATSTPTPGAKPGDEEPAGGRSAGTDAVVVPDKGPATYRTAKVSVPTTATSGRLYRYDVRVERGVELDPDEVARALERTLDDRRGWRSTGSARFSLVAAGEDADLHAYVVTPGTTDKLCYPLLTRGEVSCRSGSKVVLNAKRWVLGAKAYGSDVAGYRDYLANHEFGHALGRGHVGCPRQGRPAPVMLQQTKGLQGCTANPWPSVTRG